MPDDPPDPRSDDGGWDEIEASLDQKSIPEQVAWLEDAIDEAKTTLVLAQRLAEKVGAAARDGLLRKEEGERYVTAVTESVKDLQAMLVHQWSGANSDRAGLEQLHHIYYPRRRPDRGLAYTLDDHMFAIRRGLPFETLTMDMREGMQRKYWEMLRAYVESHPDEPVGWRERLHPPKKGAARKGTSTGKKRAGTGGKQTRTGAKGKPKKGPQDRRRKKGEK